MRPKISATYFAQDFEELDDFIEYIKANLPCFDVLKITVTAMVTSFEEVLS